MTQPHITTTAYKPDDSDRWRGQVTIEADGAVLLIDSTAWMGEQQAHHWGESLQEWMRGAAIRVLATHGAEEMSALRSQARKEKGQP